MGGTKKYFRREFQKSMFSLEYDNASDFYLACWQKNRSTIPLLLLRTIIFIGCISIMVAAMVINMEMLGSAGAWFIFLTHWGLIFNTIASGLAFAVSARAAFRGPIDASLELPWYVKAYWVMCNVSVPLAFFITVFYWATLTEFGGSSGYRPRPPRPKRDGGIGPQRAMIAEQYAMDPVLDVFIHGINSVVMLALVLCARHPARILHFYWVLGVALIYLLFTLIFHFAGGQTPFGTSAIYPMLDWDKPGSTIGVVAGSTLILAVMHCLYVAISVGRNIATRSCREDNTLTISDDDRYN